MSDIEQAHVAGSQVDGCHFRDERWFPWCLQDFTQCPERDGEQDHGGTGSHCGECESGGHQQFSADQDSAAWESAEDVCGGQLQQNDQGSVQTDHLSEFQFIETESVEVEWQCDEGLHEDDICQQAADHEQLEIVIVQQMLQGSLSGAGAGLGVFVEVADFTDCEQDHSPVHGRCGGIKPEQVLEGFSGKVSADGWSNGEAQIE